ncbi:unnamed protein product [Oncorhynchus mykiss]|uniref:Uncharacterized protein n=1 Tax=Oncorhynchus mykiss TaxID=8022 RepID=A0A060VWM4_ONCMY|nr:unnamed protein product [Oncorhynchus mykiss]
MEFTSEKTTKPAEDVEEALVAVNGVNHQPSSPPVEHGPSPVNNTPTREVDQGEKHTTKTKEPVRLEDDWDIVRRVTRATRTLVQQQQLIDVDKALEILTQKTPQLVVDHDKLKELLKRVVSKTEGYEVHQLEKLYALLCQSIYRHRQNFDKTELLQEMKREINNFS